MISNTNRLIYLAQQGMKEIQADTTFDHQKDKVLIILVNRIAESKTADLGTGKYGFDSTAEFLMFLMATLEFCCQSEGLDSLDLFSHYVNETRQFYADHPDMARDYIAASEAGWSENLTPAAITQE